MDAKHDEKTGATGAERTGCKVSRRLISFKIRRWIKQRNTPAAAFLYRLATIIRRGSLPSVPIVHWTIYQLRCGVVMIVSHLVRAFWTTPLFQSRLTRPAPNLYLYGGLPTVVGPVRLTIGSDCEMSGQTYISGHMDSDTEPSLTIGDQCAVGWQTTIMVGKRVVLGNGVLMGPRCFLAGFPGHPLRPEDRLGRRPETPDQISDIVLEDGVWLGTGVTVLAGVRIGEGTVVGTGSVVTKDLPPRVLAAGVPARTVKSLRIGAEPLAGRRTSAKEPDEDSRHAATPPDAYHAE